MRVADLVDDVVEALPDWDDVKDEAERAASAVGEWMSDTSKSLSRKTDEQTTWFIVGGVSVLALILALAWWRRSRRRDEETADEA